VLDGVQRCSSYRSISALIRTSVSGLTTSKRSCGRPSGPCGLRPEAKKHCIAETLLQRGADPNVHVDAGDFPDKRALLCGIGGAPFTSPCGAHRKSAKIPVSGLGLFQNLMVVEGLFAGRNSFESSVYR
jgi:hypothetical protein